MIEGFHQDTYDSKYCSILLSPISECASYLPKMGGSKGITLKDFEKMYGDDPLYHWMGLDNPLMFSAHKAAGGMTSLYRQLGIGVERLARNIFMDRYGLSAEDANWSYEYRTESGKKQTRYLDGRIDFSLLTDPRDIKPVKDWLDIARESLGISSSLNGLVFEVREGYKSADSKRQNGDLGNSAKALGAGYLMVMLVMSNEINEAVLSRYQNANLIVLRGDTRDKSPMTSTYAFFEDIIGYDLAGFFKRNTHYLRTQVQLILEELLSPEE